MTDIVQVLGAVQDGGGLMLAVAYLAWVSRAHRDDFKNHAHGLDGRPYVKKRASEL